MIGYFAKHPTAANLLMLLIVVMGITALPKLKRETFPEFSASQVEVQAVYPGASPGDAELALCVPMEDAVDGITDIEEISCEAREGVATMTIKLVEGGDIQRVLSDVKTEVDAINTFPDDVEKPLIREKGRNEHLITLAIAADLPMTELKDYAEEVKRQLKKIDGISLVDIQGFSDRQLRVSLSLPLLRQYGLSVQQVANKLTAQNIKLPGGTLKTQGKDILIRFDQQNISASTLANLVISSSANGSQIRLKDVGHINEQFEKDEQKILFDGKPAALLKVQKSKQGDALRLVAAIEEFMGHYRPTIPQGVEITLTQNTSQVVADRINMLTTNAWQGFILVFAVMWLFFAWRYSFWVSMGLPVSFLGAFWLMSLMGVSINMISLVGLLMAIGILMDDAIVIAESIASHIEKGLDVATGTIEGVKRVGIGVFSSFLTSIAIFTGLMFIEGDIGKVLAVMPMVLLATLVVSLVEAFLILPSHLLHSYSNGTEDETATGFKARFNDKFEAFRQNRLPNIVEACVQNRYLVVGGVVGLMLISMAMMAGGVLKFKAFPDTDGDIVEVRVLYPQGTSLYKTEKLVTHITKSLGQVNREFPQEGEESLVQHVTVEFNKNADAFETGAHVATIRVDLLTAEQRNTKLDDFVRAWRTAIGPQPGLVALTIKEPSLGPSGRAIDIRLHSSDLELLQQASAQVKTALNQFQGVYDVMDDLRQGKEERVVSLLPGAMSLGVDGSTIAQQLRAAYFGVKADDIQRNNQNIEIDVRLRDADKLSLNQLQNFPITLNDGSQKPLSSLAKLEYERSVARINRVNGERTVNIIGSIDAEQANTTEVLQQVIKSTLEPLTQEYPNLTYSLEGEIKEGNQTGKSIVSKFLFGMIGIFIILSFQFRSYFEPVMVMVATPMAMIGVIWGHLLLGFDFTMPSMVGFVSLAGIVVNDSILLVGYIKSHEKEGMSIHDAVIASSRERFRAVFITSATTIAGMIPLLLETSTQAQVLQPLVVSIVFGMISSTMLILLVLPCLYMLLKDFNLVSEHHLSSEHR